MSRLWTARWWIDSCDFAVGSSGSAEAIRKRLQRLLAMLRQKGVVKPPATGRGQRPIQDHRNEFRRYLLQERGLSPSTLLNYVPVVEQFLAERFHNSGSELRHAACTGRHRIRDCVTRIS